MREQFEIVIDIANDDGKTEQRVYKVTDNLASRILIEERIDGGVSGFIQTLATKKIRVTHLGAIAYGLIKGAGYNVTETDIGEIFVDLGESQGLTALYPIIGYWSQKILGDGHPFTTKKNSGSQRKRTKSR